MFPLGISMYSSICLFNLWFGYFRLACASNSYRSTSSVSKDLLHLLICDNYVGWLCFFFWSSSLRVLAVFRFQSIGIRLKDTLEMVLYFCTNDDSHRIFIVIFQFCYCCILEKGLLECHHLLRRSAHCK